MYSHSFVRWKEKSKQKHSPRRCLSVSDRPDIFAVKEEMTELFAPENGKGKGYMTKAPEPELRGA